MRILCLLFLLIGYSAFSQSDGYIITTTDNETIEAVNIKYSDSGEKLYVELPNGEFQGFDKDNVLSVTKTGGGFVENPDAQFLNYKLTDNKKLIWQRVFETEMGLEELQDYFG